MIDLFSHSQNNVRVERAEFPVKCHCHQLIGTVQKTGNESWEKEQNGMVKGRLKQTNPQSHAMNQAEKLMAEKVIR